jgi:hypothetical protein
MFRDQTYSIYIKRLDSRLSIIQSENSGKTFLLSMMESLPGPMTTDIRDNALDVRVGRRCYCDVRRVEHVYYSTWIEEVACSLWLEAMTWGCDA